MRRAGKRLRLASAECSRDNSDMRAHYIFDIPVYLCTLERYYRDQDVFIEKHVRSVFEDCGLSRTSAPDTLKRVEAYARTAFGGPWNFNHIVGWVRLFIEGYAVGGHLWWVDARRLSRNMRKTFYLTTSSNSLSTYFRYPTSSHIIFGQTLESLEKLAKRKPLKGRYMDLSEFRRIGQFVDWHSLLVNESGMVAERSG